MKTYLFKIEIKEDQFPDGKKAFHGFCPALKGCHTWGYTYDETYTQLQDAIQCHLDALAKLGKPIPADRVEDWSTADVVTVDSPAILAKA